MSLPTPAIDYLPKIYRDDPKATTLADKMDEHLGDWKADVANLERLIDPARTPPATLEVFGEMLAANLLSTDDEREKREKIAGAVAGHKNRGTFDDDVAIKIDAIAGGSSSIVSSVSDAWWVLSAGIDAVGDNWSAFGDESETGFDGIILTGIGDEGIFPGNVRIDVDNDSLTAAEVEQIKEAIADSVPAYFRVMLGYIISGVFYVYGEEIEKRWSYVAAYLMEGDFSDESGSGFDGTEFGMTYDDGCVEQGAVFDGVDAYGSFPSGVLPIFDLVNPFTVSCLVRLDTLTPVDGTPAVIYIRYASGVLFKLWFNKAGERFEAEAYDGSGIVAAANAPSSSATLDCVHLAVSWDGTDTLILYVAAVSYSDVQAQGTVTPTVGYVGGNQTGQSIEALVDEIRFFDSVISASDITRINQQYTDGLARSIGRIE